MSLIHVNREIFLDLKEPLKKEYVRDCVWSAFPNEEEFESSEYDYIIDGIYKVITSNEKWHEDYGIVQKNGKKQVDETCMIPGFSEPSGSYYSTGTLIIHPFDWSWDDEGNFNYSFVIARVY